MLPAAVSVQVGLVLACPLLPEYELHESVVMALLYSGV